MVSILTSIIVTLIVVGFVLWIIDVEVEINFSDDSSYLKKCGEALAKIVNEWDREAVLYALEEGDQYTRAEVAKRIRAALEKK